MEDKKKMKNIDKIEDLSTKIDKMIELQILILELLNNNKKLKKNNEIVKDNISDKNDKNIVDEEDIQVIEKSKKKIGITKTYEYKDIKKEFFNIEDKFVKDCLNMNNLSGDIKLFKKMYIENIPKEFYPIRHIQKNFQYWSNNHMVDDDVNGTYIKSVILTNIENCYLKVNTFENYSENMEQFLKNQEHINKLSENKYKDNFLNKIIFCLFLQVLRIRLLELLSFSLGFILFSQNGIK